MSNSDHVLPKTKLWIDDDIPNDPGIIVLECDCGVAVDYPGHPDARDTIACGGCGQVWTVRRP